MFLSGEVCPGASTLVGAVLFVRTGLMGQKSAEVVVPTGVGMVGKG